MATTAFEVIIKQQIKRLEEPSIKCINMVYDELVRILGQLLGKQVQSKKQKAKKKSLWFVSLESIFLVLQAIPLTQG